MGCCSSKEDGEREPLIQENGPAADVYGGAPKPMSFPAGGVILGDDGLIINSPAPTIVATNVLVGPGSSLPGDSFIADAATDFDDVSRGIDLADAAVQKVQQQVININAEPVMISRSEADKRSREYGVVTVSKPLAAAAVEAIEGVPSIASGEPTFTSADLPNDGERAMMDALCASVSEQVNLSAKEMGPLVVSLPTIPDFMK